ncbi:bifunctional diguanylate cyclase/phosphodiesterase [Teichococcus oryzae]|uniref:bifunctional diguanylate cyclase/phosphodiesterase n=1 Tax=Teichococcus oryzae TaxID=1608942 RepID=UPI001375B064|nr:GGDEF domain-containing phosphodiesterase [Pseudoroseomonas oryzae]
MITGLSGWTTHFVAMLGFAPDRDLHAGTAMAVSSLLVSMLTPAIGWLVAFGGPRRLGLVGGAITGIGLALTHSMETVSMHVADTVTFEGSLVAASLLGGLGFCILAGWLLQRDRRATTSILAAAVLAMATLTVHFLGMASATVLSGSAILEAHEHSALTALGGVVVAGAVLLLICALGVAIHGNRIAAVTARERECLLEALAALRKSEDHHRASVALNPQIPWLADPEGNATEISPRWEDLVGRPVEEGLGQGWMRHIHPDDLPRVRVAWRKALETGDGAHADTRYRLRLRDGGYRWFRMRTRARQDADGGIVAWYGTLEDIHDQVMAELALRESEERYRLAFQATHDAIGDWSRASGRIAWAGAIATVLGHPPQDHTSSDWWLDQVHPEDRDGLEASFRAALNSGTSLWGGEYRFRAADGTYRHISSRAHIVRDAKGRLARVIGSMVDVTARKAAEQELRWAAYHDPLTRLPNRAAYALRIEQAIAEARASQTSFGLIIADLDNFKMLNDTLGHAAGDTLLCQLASRLQDGVPAGATIARLGGDEFAIILPGLTEQDAHSGAVHAVLSGINASFSIEGLSIDVNFSVGAALWPRDADNAADLLRGADLALHAAKSELPGSIRPFQPFMRERAEERKRALDSARLALRMDRIAPFYQPKVCLATGMVKGFEALLRWHDHGLRLQSPSALALAFEDAELSIQITDKMLDSVIRDCLEWKAAGIEVGRIALNASSADFRRRDLADRILARLGKAGLPTSCLELEVTETVFLGKHSGIVESTLETLSDAGITIALDDFGTGYASLTHLQQFPVNVLKIDRSFVAGLSQKRAPIVDALLHMAQSLDIETVAEGVETLEQAAYLRAQGCVMGQGYLFGRPIAASCVPLVLAHQERDAALAAIRVGP